MSKWFAVFAALIVIVSAAPASAEWSRRANTTVAASSVGGGVIMHGEIYGGGKSYGMAPQGYPFYSSCCEPRSSCCRGLWAGFCGQSRCHHRARSRSSCGCGVPSCGGCSGGKGSHVSYGGKGGGCSSCGHAAPSCGCGPRRSLFSRLHASRGCGCGSVVESSCGCGVSHGKGYSKSSTKYSAPMSTYESNSDVGPAVPTPAPVSMPSANRRWAPSFRGIN